MPVAEQSAAVPALSVVHVDAVEQQHNRWSGDSANNIEENLTVRPACGAQRQSGRFCWLPVAGAIR